MITREIRQSEFVGNDIIRDAFSYSATIKLFEYYQELGDCQGEPVDFDPIAFRCEWSEYDEEELFTDFGYLLDDDNDADLESLIYLLEDKTRIIPIKGKSWQAESWLVMEF